MDAAPECVNDADCNDGLFCNGEETCSQGACVSGTAPDCGDGIGCTIDECNEDNRECRSRVPDKDGDGVGDASCLDNSGTPLGTDCDDEDINRFPGNFEVCDDEGHDEDCDDSTYGSRDVDVDGFDDANCCNGSNCGNDCDDSRTNVNIAATEACDGLDNNCDGNVDEGVSLSGWIDLDADGFGDDSDPSNAMTACAGAAQFATQGGDCDDDDTTINPGQPELCDNGVDNDCDPLTTDADAATVDWYLDSDGDGYGDPESTPIADCAPLEGRSLLATDCDDENAGINPAAAEVCDAVDNDCNGLKDFAIPGETNDFEDDDDDGLVDIACAPFGTDCDDGDANTGPGDVEVCDGRDNDCDEQVDEGAQDRQWLRDADGDGFGSQASGSLIACQTQPGFVAPGGDCDDGDEDRFPGQSETCDGLDQDCDGTVDEGEANNDCAGIANGSAICVSGSCLVESCDAGFGDCDDDAGDGCEIDLTTDGDNCGACGNQCQFGPCVGGTCTVDCGAGTQQDCDALASTGCETDTDTSNAHCGGCNMPCTDPTGTSVTQCFGGQCLVVACLNAGEEDCDGGSGNGCETDLDTDTDNCGGCGESCEILAGPGSAMCVNGDCDVMCTEPERDCDGDVENGCETRVDMDPNNCGSCNFGCPSFQNTTGAACNGGQCGIAGCMPGTSDCDGIALSGCEIDIDTDPENCGTCGFECEFALPNAVTSCNMGTCNLDECFFGFDDCVADDMMNPATLGCETDVMNDLFNCGGCGIDCNTLPNVQNGFCGGGVCSANQCNFGFGDCVPDDPMTPGTEGCETPTDTDDNNCGGCGNNCGAAGECSGGNCNNTLELALGKDHSCALRDKNFSGRGAVVCWGDNTAGQQGDGTFSPHLSANESLLLDDVIQIAAGALHTCALVDDTMGGVEVKCWGRNDNGQLGIAMSGDFETPQDVSPPMGVIGVPQEVVAGDTHSCVRDDLGSVFCWGNNFYGQLGDGTAIDPMTGGGPTVNSTPVSPMPLITNATALAAGGEFTCVRTNSPEVLCWGRGDSGQLGNMFTDHSSVPVGVINSSTWGAFQPISAGGSHVCAIVEDNPNPNSVWCWGDSALGQTGTNGGNNPSPFQIAGTDNAGSLSLGLAHSCFLEFSGGGDILRCIGDNLNNKRGTGGGNVLTTPTQVQALPPNNLFLARTGPMADHICVVSGNRSVQCWGANGSGQLGDGTSGGTSGVPDLVQNLPTF